jgi:hypothetical protein
MVKISVVVGILAAVLAMAMPVLGETQDGQAKHATVTVLTEDGGHLAWHPKEDLIAFDRMDSRGYFRPSCQPTFLRCTLQKRP